MPRSVELEDLMRSMFKITTLYTLRCLVAQAANFTSDWEDRESDHLLRRTFATAMSRCERNCRSALHVALLVIK